MSPFLNNKSSRPVPDEGAGFVMYLAYIIVETWENSLNQHMNEDLQGYV